MLSWVGVSELTECKTLAKRCWYSFVATKDKRLQRLIARWLAVAIIQTMFHLQQLHSLHLPTSFQSQR